MKLDHGTWVVVADGEKYLALRNQGDTEVMDLRVVAHEETSNPPARDMASDRPGRLPDSKTGGKKGPLSAMEETDWHRVGEARFAETLAGTLNHWAGEGRFERIVIAADPRTLGAMRPHFSADLSARISAEIGHDYTNMPVDGIEAALATA